MESEKTGADIEIFGTLQYSKVIIHNSFKRTSAVAAYPAALSTFTKENKHELMVLSSAAIPA